MYLWRKSAGEKWWRGNELRLHAIAGDRLAVIERPHCKQLQLEIASNRRTDLQTIAKQFGGHVEKLSRDWLKRALRRKTKPIKVGNQRLTIPAGAAFGTGEHATTAMCLRFLEKLTRDWDHGWSILDLGTGSGILALAAKLLGAKDAIGIDNDSIAIRTAKQNAKLNKIRGVEFRVRDVRGWERARRRLRLDSGTQADIVTANLFSELLIEIVPTLTRARWLILSGILRLQERELRRTLARNKIEIVEVRRSGKWVAMLTRCR
jgi:ribosomal protein L11 methyltransferase